MLACAEMEWHMITVACLKTGNLLPMACGTLALLIGEQAAEGQTARLRLCAAPCGGTSSH